MNAFWCASNVSGPSYGWICGDQFHLHTRLWRSAAHPRRCKRPLVYLEIPQGHLMDLNLVSVSYGQIGPPSPTAQQTDLTPADNLMGNIKVNIKQTRAKPRQVIK